MDERNAFPAQKPGKIKYQAIAISLLLAMEIIARILVSHFLDTSFIDPYRRLRESRTMKTVLALPPCDTAKFRVLVLAGSSCLPGGNDFNAVMLRCLGRPNAEIYNLAGIGKTGTQSFYEYRLVNKIHFDLVLFYQGINDFKKFSKLDVDLLLLNHPECAVTSIPLALHHFALHHFPEPLNHWFFPKADIFKSIRSMIALSKAKKENLILPTFAYLPDSLNGITERFRLGYYNDPAVLQGKLEDLNSFIRCLESPYLKRPDLEKIIPKNEKYFYDVCHFTQSGTVLFIKSILADSACTPDNRQW